jgi:hypothetical protein
LNSHSPLHSKLNCLLISQNCGRFSSREKSKLSRFDRRWSRLARRLDRAHLSPCVEVTSCQWALASFTRVRCSLFLFPLGKRRVGEFIQNLAVSREARTATHLGPKVVKLSTPSRNFVGMSVKFWRCGRRAFLSFDNGLESGCFSYVFFLVAFGAAKIFAAHGSRWDISWSAVLLGAARVALFVTLLTVLALGEKR